MALIDLPRTAPALSLKGILSHMADVIFRPSARPLPGDTERRDFLLDAMREHGDAIRSEADVQCMMSVYPGRF